MLKCPRLFVNHIKALATPSLLDTADSLSQQTRNTFILKRRYPIRLYKKNQKRHNFKRRDFIYDLVEDTNIRKKEPVKMILTQYVKGLGNAGTQVSMSPGLAYYQLLLPRLADYATPENIERYTKLAKDLGDRTPFSSATVENMIKYLSEMRLIVEVSKEIPWTLEKWHIKANFRKSGIHAPEETITMPERPISGPNPDLEGKEFYVTLTINNREQAKVRCCLHHWSPILQIQDMELLSTPGEPIFSEDKPILDSMPAFRVEKKT
ncbi:PREDICTED: 39S ribosomal protein L9, mitochondrial [Dinoponera quadriceps]|uniref:Large ribosomal subunit protein bL9m n=1 Tax=Dinoponera quadriceps TaxID=609295 RepID=A0A6P3XNA9_DINQU|nr:PREDICTED: 39S ribosomal protein L9, mitochondrial [Dinoponera quadriceps]